MDLLFVRLFLFFVLTAFFLKISWRALHNSKCHGFYRFFAFEGILILFLLNVPFWFRDLYSPLQIISWLLLFTSLFFLGQGVYLLRKRGGLQARRETPENLPFENTVHLVTDGIYRYIRHPLYSSLLLLAWGIFFKNPTFLALLVLIPTTAALVATARMEERENFSFFGPVYGDYVARTKWFIPFLF